MAEVGNGLYRSASYRLGLSYAVEAAAGIASFSGSSVLVVGATGLIGSFLVDMLGYASAELGLSLTVVAAGRDIARLRGRYGGCPWTGPSLVEFDVRRGPGPGVPPCDLVVHAASNSHPASITSDPVGTIQANVDGTLTLLEWGRANGARRLLYMSSGEVYGVSEGFVAAFPEHHQGYVDPLSMRSCYPLSKRVAECLCVSYLRQYGTDCVIARLCHTFGPTAMPSDSRASSQFIARAAAGDDVVLASEGAQVRSWCHVADAASGIASVLALGESGRAYNVASRRSVASIAEFARLAASAGGVNLVRSEALPRAADETPIARQVLDASALESLGWAPRLTLEEGISQAVAAAKEAS